MPGTKVPNGARALPVIYLSHGGGPCFFMNSPQTSPFHEMDASSELCQVYKRAAATHWPAAEPPRAIVVCSAHWESAPHIAVTSKRQPGLLYDYYGFPPHTYELKYDAPGHPELAHDIQQLLEAVGLPCKEDATRDWDHGVFIPLKLTYPDAEVPVVQVSLHGSLDPGTHLRMGEALAPLREQGVLLLASGQTTHNLKESFQAAEDGRPRAWAAEFVAWLHETLTSSALSADERRARLLQWLEKAPHGRKAHPREEHLLPVFVACAAGGYAPAKGLWESWVGGHMAMHSYKWGQ